MMVKSLPKKVNVQIVSMPGGLDLSEFSWVKLQVSALAKGLANIVNMEWKAEVVLEGTLACYQSLGASGVDSDRSLCYRFPVANNTCNVYSVEQ